MRTIEEVNNAEKLYIKTKNICEVSRQTGIPRSTLRYILGLSTKKINGKEYKYKGGKSKKYNLETFNPKEFLKNKEDHYSFILGAYFGDGYINKEKNKRSYRLTISNNRKDTKVKEEQVKSLKVIFTENSVWIREVPNSNCDEVKVTSNIIPIIFPQYAGGAKHLRKIILKNWQEEIINKYPKEFIKGLFWSDGCRYVHNQGNYSYTYYNFTNCSEDIIKLCGYYLKNINIKYTIVTKSRGKIMKSKAWVITVRTDSYILDTFIGPKF